MSDHSKGKTTGEWLAALRAELSAIERISGPVAMMDYLRVTHPALWQAIKDDPRVRKHGLVSVDGFLPGFEPEDPPGGRS